MKASVVDACSTDIGESQKHDLANLAGAEEVDRLGPTAFQKPSENVEAANVDHAKTCSKEFSSLEKQINTLIAFMTPNSNIHKEIKKTADGIDITYSRLQKIDSRFLEMPTTPMQTDDQQTAPSRVKETGIPKGQAHGGEANGTRGKRKISPL